MPHRHHHRPDSAVHVSHHQHHTDDQHLALPAQSPPPVVLPATTVIDPPPASTAPATPVDQPHTPAATDGAHQPFLMGINLSGAEFGNANGGHFGTDYTYPTHSEIDYYGSKGMSVIRLPFLMERLQDGQNGPLNAAEMQRVDDVVSYANAHGMKVVLDAHNFGAAFGHDIGSPKTPNAVFADFWGKVAGHFAQNSNVMFGLMNEPHNQTAQDWLASSNAAISAIRGAGANAQEILVSGTHWDGAWTWTSSDNASVIGKGIIDPQKNVAFEVHQYLDSDGSGTHTNVVSDTIGVDRLKDATAWAEATGNKLFLGEFAVAQDAQSLHAMDLMLAYVKDHPAAWQGATYWGGGPWWGSYMYSAEPANGVDKPQIALLEKYAAASASPPPAATHAEVAPVAAAQMAAVSAPLASITAGDLLHADDTAAHAHHTGFHPDHYWG